MAEALQEITQSVTQEPPQDGRGAHNRGKKWGKPFEKGGKKVSEPDPGPIEQEEGMPDQLAEMLHVCKRPASADTTPLQKTCRAWLRDNTSAFMKAKTELETEFLEYKTALLRGAVGEAGSGSAPSTLQPPAEEPDEPLEEMIRLVCEDLKDESVWMQEYREKDGKP